eukprot:TRINITY_DN20409_c0_g1_i1.p1 TRINITY_DN20409_c0_g1~~TRINITY_DN20409_c0_g1_i1.p1  ORF type:complete len:484 (+),score=176.98 TRINITY_DN20409_c0_g1_i1:138-1454(+)
MANLGDLSGLLQGLGGAGAPSAAPGGGGDQDMTQLLAQLQSGLGGADINSLLSSLGGSSTGGGPAAAAPAAAPAAGATNGSGGGDDGLASALSSLLGPGADLGGLARSLGLPATTAPEGPEPAELPPLSVEARQTVERVVDAKRKRDVIRNKTRPEHNALYIVLKAPRHELLTLSAQKGLWAVSPETEEALNHAYDSNSCVVLIFSVRDSGFFIGYAFMSTQIKPREEQPASLRQDYESLPAEWRNPFRVSWVRAGSVPFKDVAHLRNKHDGDRLVIHAQDGQVLPEREAHILCNQIDYAAARAAIKAGVTRVVPPPPKRARHPDVTSMSYEEYVVGVLTKRKQRLRAARRHHKLLEDTDADPGPTRVVLPPSSPPAAASEQDELESLLQNPEIAGLLQQLSDGDGADPAGLANLLGSALGEGGDLGDITQLLSTLGQ